MVSCTDVILPEFMFGDIYFISTIEIIRYYKINADDMHDQSVCVRARVRVCLCACARACACACVPVSVRACVRTCEHACVRAYL